MNSGPDIDCHGPRGIGSCHTAHVHHPESAGQASAGLKNCAAVLEAARGVDHLAAALALASCGEVGGIVFAASQVLIDPLMMSTDGLLWTGFAADP